MHSCGRGPSIYSFCSGEILFNNIQKQKQNSKKIYYTIRDDMLSFVCILGVTIMKPLQIFKQ